MPILDLAERRRNRADRLHRDAMALTDQGRNAAAIDKYLEALRLDPCRSESLYNIGLIYKYERQWERSFEFNQRAYALAPDDEAARWNLAIAATALRRWDVVRRLWADQGIALSGEAGPIEMDFGVTPVRLDPDGAGEVVWATRIDPVRARIESVPLPESGFRHADIVLHDGAAVGHRKVDGREYPVFNVLELFQCSDQRTFRAIVETDNREAVTALERRAGALGIEVEDWTVSLTVLCRQCSEGTPHGEHDAELDDGRWAPRRRLGISASKDHDVRALVTEWCASARARLLELSCELEPG